MENLVCEENKKIAINEEGYLKSSMPLDPKKNEIEVDLEFDKLMIGGIKENNYIPFPTKNIYSKNDFEVLELLGKGAYAKVVKAKCLKDNSLKSIKIIDKNFMERVSYNFKYLIIISGT